MLLARNADSRVFLLPQAFVQMQCVGSPDVEAIIESTYSILYFGCPNRGMPFQHLFTMCGGKASEPLLQSFRQDSERLRQLSRDFPRVFSSRDFRNVSFLETQPSPTAVKVSHPHLQTELHVPPHSDS